LAEAQRRNQEPFNAGSCLEGISNRWGPKPRSCLPVDVPPLDGGFESSEFVTAPNGESGLKGEIFQHEELKGALLWSHRQACPLLIGEKGSFAAGRTRSIISRFVGQANRAEGGRGL